MAHRCNPDAPRWSTPVLSVRLGPSGQGVDDTEGLRDLLHPDDAEAGVAESLVALARAHGRVEDQRLVRQPDGRFEWSALVLAQARDSLTLQAHPSGPAHAASRRVAADHQIAGALRSRVRHDLYAPLSTAASALELLEGDLQEAAPAAKELAGTVRDAVAAAAAHSLALGSPPPAQEPSPCWVDTRVFIDALLARLQPDLAARRLTVTRGVFPSVFADPHALWRDLTEAVRTLCFAGRAGAHLHIDASWTGDSLSVLHHTVREPEDGEDTWGHPSGHTG